MYFVLLTFNLFRFILEFNCTIKMERKQNETEFEAQMNATFTKASSQKECDIYFFLLYFFLVIAKIFHVFLLNWSFYELTFIHF